MNNKLTLSTAQLLFVKLNLPHYQKPIAATATATATATLVATPVEVQMQPILATPMEVQIAEPTNKSIIASAV